VRAKVVVAALIVALVGVIGVGSQPGAGAASSSSGGSDTCTAKRVGGTMTVGAFSMQPTLDPGSRNILGAGGSQIFANVYDTLLRYDTKTNEITPGVATGITHNKTLTQYTLKLRPGLKFGNGDPFDANAVATAQNRYITKGSFTGFQPYIASIVAVDPTTVQYNLKLPWTVLPIQLGLMFGMIANQNVVDKLGAGFGSAVSAGAGVGPYEVTTFAPPGQVVLKAKSDYWGGPVCIQQITLTTVTNSQQGIDSFKTGQYQTTIVRDAAALKSYLDSKPTSGTVSQTLVVGAAMIIINTTATAAHLDDVRVRQAIQYANDVNVINQRAFQGALIAHTSLVPKGLGVVGATKGPAYDPKRATKLLNEVKSETGWDGSIDLTCAQGTSADQGIALAALLNNVGFKVNLDTTLPVTPWVTKVQINRDYQLGCSGFQAFNGDYWSAFYPRTFSTPTNYSNWHNADWDAAMADLAAADVGTPGYQKAIDKIQQLQTQLVPQVFDGSYPEATLISSSLHGVVMTRGDTALYGQAFLANK
jgi:peptide/nickel transport system substrate-binding protein